MDAGSRPNLNRYPFVDKMAGPVRSLAYSNGRNRGLESARAVNKTDSRKIAFRRANANDVLRQWRPSCLVSRSPSRRCSTRCRCAPRACRCRHDDIKQILSGLFSIANGVGAFRTHEGSAHGHGNKSYKIEARHARLAVHAAHTMTMFVLETWEARKKKAPINSASATT